MWDHGLAAEGGVEAAWDPTEHWHLEVQPDVVVQCLVILCMILTEGAETAVYPDQISTAINIDVLCHGDLAHGHLRHQVMQSDVLVIPEFPIWSMISPLLFCMTRMKYLGSITGSPVASIPDGA